MNAVDLLNLHSLKRTSCREGILEIMLNSTMALSENEIRDRLAGKYDRTTFYRSFKTLEENKILHKIVVDNLMVKYAIDNSAIKNKNHIHFCCNSCHTVRCVDTVEVLDIKLPDGYIPCEIEILIKGTCANCNK